MATVVVTFILLAGCSGTGGGGGTSASPVLPSGSPALPSSTTEALTGPPIDLRSLSGRIVFDNFQDIWSVNADGTGLTRLTTSPWPEFDPTWSPDGRFIAYRSEPNGHPQVWIMDADGSGQHRLTRDGGFPTWSPNGSMLAYAPAGGSSGKSSIALMDPDGSGKRRVPRTEWGEYPSWSPDGRRIAFNSNITGEALMYIVDVHDSRGVDLSSVGEGGQVAWSPDGRSILFASHRDHPDNWRDIYVMRPDGSGVRRLTHGGGETPAWSPDGRYIIFSTLGGFGLMRADGSGVTSLPLEGVGEATFPDWR